MNWEEAPCAQMNGDLFFPHPRNRRSDVRDKVCGDCPLTEQCLELGLSSKFLPSGVWGGRAEAEVRYLWRARRRHLASVR